LHFLSKAGVFCGVVYQYDFFAKVWMALAKLHNFCIDESDIPVRQLYHEDVLEGNYVEVLVHEVFLDEEEQHFLTIH
jgi:hypothetical protein